MNKIWTERFGGIDRLYGTGALARFADAHVTVVGIGGVGSWAVEALARSGIGKLTLIDADDLCVSNTNRQLPALQGQFGRAKVEAMGERCRAINPGIVINLKAQFLTRLNLDELLGTPCGLVLDACDSSVPRSIACARTGPAAASSRSSQSGPRGGAATSPRSASATCRAPSTMPCCR